MDPWALLDRAARAADASGLHWEVRTERGVRTTLALQNGTVAEARQVATEGLGARLAAHGASGYRFTNTMTGEAAEEAVHRAAEVARAHARALHEPLPEPARVAPGRLSFRSRARRWPRDVPIAERLDLLRRAERAGRDRLGREGTVACQWGDWQGERHLRTADGVQASAELVLSSIQVVVSVREAGQVHGDKASVGGALGLEAYDGEKSPEALGKLAAERCLDAMRARKAPAGPTPAIVDPALGGILAHESFGHLTEGDVVRSGYSLLQGRTGEQLGSQHATVVDEGLAEPGAGVEVPFDEEGVAAQRVVVLDRGKLGSWLHSRGTAAREGVQPTGNARAV
ncbi:MAG: TldD/PmbA family protein, partial [Halobacteriales archaeon]|nr:TldD/PmbA family protein [Halobacteriales archaeon]